MAEDDDLEVFRRARPEPQEQQLQHALNRDVNNGQNHGTSGNTTRSPLFHADRINAPYRLLGSVNAEWNEMRADYKKALDDVNRCLSDKLRIAFLVIGLRSRLRRPLGFILQVFGPRPGKLQLHILAAWAEFERGRIKDRIHASLVAPRA